MSVTYQEAVNDIFSLLKKAWDPTGFQIFYDDIAEERETGTFPWASAIIRHAGGTVRSLGGKDNRDCLRFGFLLVSVYTPSGSGLSEAYRLCKVITDAYEATSSPNDVWFRNVRINERGRDGSFFKIDVIIDFEYTETK